jgi:hypothetical protein
MSYLLEVCVCVCVYGVRCKYEREAGMATLDFPLIHSMSYHYKVTKFLSVNNSFNITKLHLLNYCTEQFQVASTFQTYTRTFPGSTLNRLTG